jgi:hypothetical protein
MQMGMSIQECGRKTRLMEKELIIILMEPDMREIGKKISSMEEEKRRGPMVLSMKVIIKMERNMALESSSGQMEVLIQGHL